MHQVALHLWPAQIEHAMRETDRFRQVLVVELKWRRHRCIQDLDLGRQHFDLARDKVWIRRSFGPKPHAAHDRDAVFIAQLFGDGERLGTIGIAHDLHEALAVAQIDEDHAAVIATAMDPSAQ